MSEQPFPIVGKLRRQLLEPVLALRRPDEQPRFVVAEGIYGALVAFEDRLAIVKDESIWRSGGGRSQTYPYSEIGEVRFSAGGFTGRLEIVEPDEVNGRETFWRQQLDVQKRMDAMALTVDVFEQAGAHIKWLRAQIAGPYTDLERALDEMVRWPVVERDFSVPEAVVEEIVDAVLVELVRALDDRQLPLVRRSPRP
jgi:hypothetical protein